MRKRKTTAVFVHILAVAIVVVSSWTLKFNNYSDGANAYSELNYEDSYAYAMQFSEMADAVMEKVHLGALLETDGELDRNKFFVQIIRADSEEIEDFSLNDFILYGKQIGLYLDNSNNLVEDTGYATGDDGAELLRKTGALDLVISPEEYVLSDGDDDGRQYISLNQLTTNVLTVLSNYSLAAEQIGGETNFIYRLSYGTPENEDEIVYTNAPDKTLEQLKGIPGKFIFMDYKGIRAETNFEEFEWVGLNDWVRENNRFNKTAYSVWMSVDSSYPVKTDLFYLGQGEYETGRQIYIYGNLFLGLGFALAGLSFLYLVYVSGQRERDGALILNRIDRGKTELALIAWALVGLVLWYGMRLFMEYMYIPAQYRQYAAEVGSWLVVYVIAFLAVFSMVRRVKAKIFWQNSLIRMAYDNLSILFSKSSMGIRISALFVGYLSMTGLIVFLGFFSIPAGIVCGVLFEAFVFYKIMRREADRQRLRNGIERIAEGDSEYYIEESNLHGSERVLAEKMNQISTGLKHSMEEKMKSERLKTDLITNVSHDIKTPLTSIINYVDLIKREPIQDQKIISYIEVLDQKANRLKTLTDDLVEASKASSGNINLEFMNIDFVELVNQTNGEFEERFRRAGLNIVNTLPAEPVIVKVDGRRMWRVLENLYTNVIKYAMTGTRVYIDLVADDKEAVFSVKNVSKFALNISADELTERFVRGDVSRSTEGSGLGLSIAKSLTKLQGGEFELVIDGDLFKAIVSMPLASEFDTR